MKYTVVILNGPPGCGKDTLAEHFEAMGWRHARFKDSLVPLILSAYNVSAADFAQWSQRDTKEVPRPELCHMSPRAALINMSERVIKPMFGAAAFAIATARHLEPDTPTVISNGGFRAELAPIFQRVGARKVAIIQMARPGCTFANDSRSYYPDRLCDTFRVNNDGDVAQLVRRVCSLLV